MPDLDKLVRGLNDALTGVVFEDDSQIDQIVAVKRYGVPERTEVKVWDSSPALPAPAALDEQPLQARLSLAL
jgi:hypothetical protein